MKTFFSLLFVTCMMISELAFAGSNCNNNQLSPAVVKNAAEASLQLKKLDALQPEVAIIARVRSDSSKYGIKYTHAAYAIKNKDWDVIHLLNQCGTKRSTIFNQGLLNFYLDDLFTMDTLLTIPDKKTKKF